MASQKSESALVPALIVVDFQNDFCPPSGSLAVEDARSIAPAINTLLSLPFTLKIATQDFHPPDHISFATNHPAPDNIPFEFHATISNPLNPSETVKSRLWPVHCVQGTPGADFVDELDISKIDAVVQKGQDKRVEMYSAFSSPFTDPPFGTSELEGLLRGKGVTDVFVTGLAMDICVRETAVHALERGWRVWVIREGTRGVSREGRDIERGMREVGVGVVSMDGEEVGRVRELGGR